MARLVWDVPIKDYEYGVDRGVLYFGEEFIVWNGLVNVEEVKLSNPPRSLYFEGITYSLKQNQTDYTAGVEAFTYPYLLESHILAMCDTRTNVGIENDGEFFNFTYRTRTNSGYKIHLVYGISAVFEGYTYQSIGINQSVEPFTFTFYATPVDVPNARASAHFIVESERADSNALAILEDLLYGSDNSSPRFPSVEHLVYIFKQSAVLL